MQISLAAAAAVALVIAVVSQLSGHPAWVACECVLATGLAAGCFAGARQQVSDLQAACYADWRFELHDLLATALTLMHGADKDFAAAVLAQADWRCRALNSAEVVSPIANRRAWAATGLAVALVLAVVQLPQRAVSSEISQANGLAESPSSDVEQLPGMDVTPMRPAGDGSLDELSNRPTDQQSVSQGDGNAGGGSASPSPGDEPSTGGGIARTNVSVSPIQIPLSNTATGTSHDGLIAGGGGRGDGRNGSGDSGARTGSSANTPSAAPWQSAAWPAAQSAARQALQTGRIDPAYQPIVRDYFLRP
jgi:hypothetical protein